MKGIKILGLILLFAFGIFLFVFGGYDDSPGAQLLGLVVAVSSVVAGFRRDLAETF